MYVQKVSSVFYSYRVSAVIVILVICDYFVVLLQNYFETSEHNVRHVVSGLKVDKKIENPAVCELRSVIRFLIARNTKPADIHRQIYEVYGENTMSDSMV